MKKGKNIQEFGQLLGQNINKQVKVQTLWCKVEEVNWDEKTMTAKGIQDDLPFNDIQLGLGSFYRRPKAESLCLIGIIANQEASAFLIDAEAFEEAVWYSGESELIIKEDGFIIKQSGESLKTVFNDWQTQFGKLCDEVNKIVVSIGVSPNVPIITQIKTEVDTNIKNRLNNILIE